jgi:hypothetical protein
MLYVGAFACLGVFLGSVVLLVKAPNPERVALD